MTASISEDPSNLLMRRFSRMLMRLYSYEFSVKGDVLHWLNNLFKCLSVNHQQSRMLIITFNPKH